MFFIGSLAAILVASQGALAVGSPFGFATGTTGSGSAAAATPTSTAQLASWWVLTASTEVMYSCFGIGCRTTLPVLSSLIEPTISPTPK
jgi:hypothetical protein